MSADNPERLKFVLVVLIAGVIWFSLLGHRDLFDPDEGRYAQIPGEMVNTGDWLTPRLDGVKYFEKPAFQYWAVASVFVLAGKSNATARLVPALLGFLGALFAAHVAARIYGRRARYFAFLIASSGLMWLSLAHILNLDMAVSTFLLFGIGSLVLAQIDRGDRRRVRRWMLAGWAALALAVLTKGLIGIVLPGAAVVVYSIWRRDFSIWRHLHLGSGLLVFMALAAPWFIAVSHANPEFARFFFIHEHWERYTSEVHHREGPLYYFVPYLLIGVLPWLVVSLVALARPGFNWRQQDRGGFDAPRFLWSFAAVTFLFFSLGDSKLPAYILPIMPVIAILAAGRMAVRGRIGGDRWVLAVLTLVLFALAFESDRFVSPLYPAPMIAEISDWIIAAGILFGLSSIAAFVLGRKPVLACGVVSLTSMLAIQCMLWGLQPMASVRSGRELADAVQAAVPASAPVYTIQTFSESLPFYLDRIVIPVQYGGELTFGLQQEPAKGIHQMSSFRAEWARQEQAAAIVDVPRLDEFFPNVDPAKIVYLGPKRAVVIK